MKVSITAKNGKTNKLYNNKMVMVNGHECGTLGKAHRDAEVLTFFSRCPSTEDMDGMQFNDTKELKTYLLAR